MALVDITCPLEWGHPLNSGLVGEWTVIPNAGWRGGATWRDLVRGGRNPHDGTLTNGPTWGGAVGRRGGLGSLSFSGSSQYTDHGTYPSVAHTYAAMAFWAWQANSNQVHTVGFSGAAGSRFQLLFFGQTLYAQAESGGSQSYNILSFVSGNADPSGWHHWVMSFDGSQGTADNRVVIYRDGVAQTLTHSTGTYPTTYTPTGGFFIGRDQQNGLYTTGLTDAVQLFFDAPVTASRAAALYDQSCRGNPDRWRRLSPRTYSFPVVGNGGLDVPAASPSAARVLDVNRPVNWSHPLARGLSRCWLPVSNSGWRGGLSWRDLVRGGRNPTDGTLSGATWQGAKGLPNGQGSVGVTGGTYAELSMPAIGSADDYAVVITHRPTSWPGGFTPLIGSNTTSDEWTISFDTSGNLSFISSAILSFVSGTGNMTAGSWWQVVFTRRKEDGVSSWYVNGKLVAENGTTSINASAAATTIRLGGVFANGSGSNYNGVFGSVLCYAGRGLTRNDVSRMWAETRNGYPELLNWLDPTSSFGSTATSSLAAVGLSAAEIWSVRKNVGLADVLLWNVRADVGKSDICLWNTRLVVGQSRQGVWNVRSAVGLSDIELWNSRANTGLSESLVWNVRKAVGLSEIDLWNTRVGVGKADSLLWNARADAGKSVAELWNTRAAVGQQDSIDWAVRILAGAQDQLVWRVRKAAGLADAILWNARAPVGLSDVVPWNVRNAVSLSEILRWHVRTKVGASNQDVWNLLSAAVGKELAYLWNVAGNAGLSLRELWNVHTTVNKSETDLWSVRVPVGASRVEQWRVRACVMNDPNLLWNVAAHANISVALPWHVRGTINSTRVLPWAVRTTAGKSEADLWNVRAAVGKTDSSVWSMRKLVALSRVLRSRVFSGSLDTGDVEEFDLFMAAVLASNLVVTGQLSQDLFE